MAYRETSEVAIAVVRLIGSVGRRLADEDPTELEHLIAMEHALKEAYTVAVRGMRDSGFSDGEIGKQLGVTKQAIQQRFPRA